MPALLHAQRDDSKYLAGAVPEADGKVVFTKDFSIPGMSQDTIYSRLLRWMDARLAKNGNNSRVVFSDKEKGQIVGIGDEWIVFSSTALSLDRTKILYQLTVTCQPEKCVFEVEKIRFNYREGKEKYTAEEWITDKYALNKSQTKLVRGLAKWRRKTVDFVDALCIEVTEALSASTAAQAPVEEKKEEKKETKALVNSGTTVIAPKTQVTVETPKATATTPATATVTVITTDMATATVTGAANMPLSPAPPPTASRRRFRRIRTPRTDRAGPSTATYKGRLPGASSAAAGFSQKHGGASMHLRRPCGPLPEKWSIQ